MKLLRILGLLMLGSSALAETAELVPTYQSIRDVVFTAKCLMCHAPGQKGEEVPLEPYAKIMENGQTVVAGSLDQSAIIAVIEKGAMPPKRSQIAAVTPEELAAIKIWITNGAKP